MRVIVFGCGRVGARLALSYADQRHEVVVMDRDEGSFVRLGPDFSGTTFVATGADPETFRRAGVDGAEAFVAVTDQDNLNLMAVQMAHEVFRVKRGIARVFDPVRAQVFRDTGIETFCPTLLSVEAISRLIEDD